MSIRSTIVDRGQRWIRHRYYPLHVALIAMALVIPSLKIGLLIDDNSHRFALTFDPIASPLKFLGAFIERAPLLMMGQWSIPSNLHMLLSEQAGRMLWWFAIAVVVIVVTLAAPLVRRDPVARFFAAGMLLSIVPACSTLASDRLLFFVGIGGIGLLGQLLAGIIQQALWLPRARAWRAVAYAATIALVLFHFVRAPMLTWRASNGTADFGGIIQRAADSLPHDAAVADQDVVIVNTPTFLITSYGRLFQLLAGRSVPRRVYVLGSSIRPIAIARPDETTLVVSPEGGFFSPPGARLAPDEAAPTAFDPHYVYGRFDKLYRDTPMHAGQTLDLDRITVTVRSITDDGRPLEVAFRFSTPLEDQSLRWMQWTDGRLTPTVPPPIGSSIKLDAATVPSSLSR